MCFKKFKQLFDLQKIRAKAECQKIYDKKNVKRSKTERKCRFFLKNNDVKKASAQQENTFCLVDVSFACRVSIV